MSIEATLPIGPYHPALKEPEFFKLFLDGEKVVDVAIRLGYTHRGIEYLAQRKTYNEIPFLVERICGICSNVHPMCFCQAVEEAWGIQVPDRARYIRTIVGELERIHSHLLWAGVAAHIIGYDTLFMHFWKHREPVCEIFEVLTGNRQNYAMNCIGGVRRDIDPTKHKALILETLSQIRPSLVRLVNAVTEDPVVSARIENIGVLSKDQARKLCVVGPVARASGLAIDVRKDEPYAAYKEVGVDVKVLTEGDVLSRMLVRLLEALESIDVIKRALDAMPQGSIRFEPKEIVPGDGIGKVEAPRGEDIHYVRSNGTDIPERVKIRAPSYMNIPSIAPQIKGASLADASLIIAAVDPCFCCTERIAIVDVKTSRESSVDFESLAQSWRRKSKHR